MAEELPIKYVKYKGEKFLPITSTKAVVDENGVSVEDLLLKEGNVYEFAKNEMDKTINLYDKSKNQIGYEINSGDGTITANSNYFVSDYVNVEGMSNVYVSGERTTGNSFCFYDVNKTFLSTYRIFDNNNSYVGNVVVPTNAVYMRFNGILYQQDIWISKYGEIIHEGYKPYQFAKNEYEKALNVLGLTDIQYTVSGVTFTVKDGEITINGTANNDITWYNTLYERIPAGEYSLNLIITGGSYTGNSRFGLSVNYWFENLSATLSEPTKTSNLGSSTNETLMYVNNGQTFNNLKIRPMLLKGSSIPTEFYQYNGAMVHKKELSAVVAWTNANPNTALSPTTITLGVDANNYDFYYIFYKQYATWGAQEKVLKLRNQKNYSDSVYCDLIDIDVGTTLKTTSRDLAFPTNKTINIHDCYSSQVVNNNRMIITRIWMGNI